MRSLIRIVGSRDEEPGMFIPFPRPIHDTKPIDASLPELQKKLSKKWPISEVRVQYRIPRLRENPIDPSQVQQLTFMRQVAEGVFVVFLGRASMEAGKEFGKGVGKEMAKIVNKWLKRMERKKETARKRTRVANPGKRVIPKTKPQELPRPSES